jgi:hypothetical protein
MSIVLGGAPHRPLQQRVRFLPRPAKARPWTSWTRWTGGPGWTPNQGWHLLRLGVSGDGHHGHHGPDGPGAPGWTRTKGGSYRGRRWATAPSPNTAGCQPKVPPQPVHGSQRCGSGAALPVHCRGAPPPVHGVHDVHAVHAVHDVHCPSGAPRRPSQQRTRFLPTPGVGPAMDIMDQMDPGPRMDTGQRVAVTTAGVTAVAVPTHCWCNSGRSSCPRPS